MNDWWVRMLALFLALTGIAAMVQAQRCPVKGKVDIIWVLDASETMQTDVGGYSRFDALTTFVSNFSQTLSMGENDVRQGFVQFAGPVDFPPELGIDTSAYQTIHENLNVTDTEAVSQFGFSQLLRNLSVAGGSKDTAGAIHFVRTAMLNDDNFRADSARIVILATDGFPSTSTGFSDSQVPSEEEAAALVDEDLVHFVLMRFDDTNNYPANFFRDQADAVYDSKFTSIEEVIDHGFLCFIFDEIPSTLTPTGVTQPPTSSPSTNPTTSLPSSYPTISPSASPSSASPSSAPLTTTHPSSSPTQQPSTRPTRRPTALRATQAPTLDGSCLPLRTNNDLSVGRVCVGVNAQFFQLEFLLDDGWVMNQTQSWIGLNPTTVPYAKGGIPIPQQFPFQSSFVDIPLASLDFVYPNCDIYVLPYATVYSKEVILTDPIPAFAGDVPFSPQAEALIFKTSFPDCQPPTSLPTSQPTLPQTSTPTLSPSEQPTVPAWSEFDFTVVYTSSVSEEQRVPFEYALEQFKYLFTRDYATYSCFEAGTVWCGYTFPTRECVNDILLLVSFNLIDGPGGALAQTGPCVINEKTEQVRVSTITFDPVDYAEYLAAGNIESLIIHQLMHAVGFGARWNDWGLVRNESGSDLDSTYIGVQGLAGYAAVGGASTMNVSNDLMHWSESVFVNELMTPVLNDHLPRDPLSVMSIQSLADMGFKVNTSKADYYTIPQSPSLRMLQGSLVFGQADDVVILEPMQYSNWTVKPGRDEDLVDELLFASLHFPTKAPTPAPSQEPDRSVPPDQIGLIVGLVLGILFLCLLLALFAWHCRKEEQKSSKEKKEDLKHAFDEPEPRIIIKSPDSPAVVTTPTGNWVERNDGGRTFWINEDTGEFSWVPPEALTRKPEPDNSASFAQKRRRSSAGKKLIVGNDVWTEQTDVDGRTYWLNEESGEFSWVAPGTPNNKSFKSNPSPINRVSTNSFSNMPTPPPPIPGSSNSNYAMVPATMNNEDDLEDFAPNFPPNREHMEEVNTGLDDDGFPQTMAPGIEEFDDSPNEDDGNTHDGAEDDEDHEANYVPRSYLPVPPTAANADAAENFNWDTGEYGVDSYQTESLPHFSARNYTVSHRQLPFERNTRGDGHCC